MKRVLLFLLYSYFFTTNCIAAPPDDSVHGTLVFLGVTSDSSRSVWLSSTSPGSFKLEAQGNQLIDEWSMSDNGLRLSLSPIVSQGNGGTHFLINSVNNKKLDSTNQQGGIVFPPLPTLPPGVVTPPIANYPTHPIVIPPIEPPIAIPPTASNTSPASPATNKSSSDVDEMAPITSARQFDQENSWNIWSDNRYFNISDHRYGLASKGKSTDFSIGADYRIARPLVTGILISHEYYDISAFENELNNTASGYNIGPYFGYQVSPKLSMDGSLTYGQLYNKNTLLSLNSSYTTQVISGSLHATGLYSFNKFQLRPQPLISYTHYSNPSYLFQGAVLGSSTSIIREKESFNFGYVEFKVEGNYTTETKNNNILQPYTDIGIDYAFVRPNNGQILTGNLNLASTSPLDGTITAGIRTLLNKSLLIDASAAYLSIGQNGLDVWELRLLASYSFS